MSDTDPVLLFDQWLADAVRSEPDVPNAAALATVDPSGAPSVRMVLIKGHDTRGFSFYTNLGSHKAHDLEGNARAALCVHWKSLHRQVRVEGHTERVPDEEADAYFATRARGSQIGAWASRQSEPMEGPWTLEKEVARHALKFGVGTVPRPPFWGGFRLIPSRLEFWEDVQFRLHRRREFRRSGDQWALRYLFP